jgi:hypothetical protein
MKTHASSVFLSRVCFFFVFSLVFSSRFLPLERISIFSEVVFMFVIVSFIDVCFR